VSTDSRSLRLPTRRELSLLATFLLAFCAAYLGIHEILYGGPVYTAAEQMVIGLSLGVAATGAYVLGTEAASRTDSSPGKGR